MPLGIVSDEDFDAELTNCIHVDVKKGRGPVKEVPEVMREIIAEDAILSNDKIVDIASRHGISSSSVTAYKNGATSTTTYNEPNERLSKKNDEIRSSIISKARTSLLAALDGITPEKLADAKLRDIASVAKDMSAVIHNTEPQIMNQQLNAQFVFHVPKQKQESDFNVIEVTQ